MNFKKDITTLNAIFVKCRDVEERSKLILALVPTKKFSISKYAYKEEDELIIYLNYSTSSFLPMTEKRYNERYKEDKYYKHVNLEDLFVDTVKEMEEDLDKLEEKWKNI